VGVIGGRACQQQCREQVEQTELVSMSIMTVLPGQVWWGFQKDNFSVRKRVELVCDCTHGSSLMSWTNSSGVKPFSVSDRITPT
jgi:hypothetical protein